MKMEGYSIRDLYWKWYLLTINSAIGTAFRFGRTIVFLSCILFLFGVKLICLDLVISLWPLGSHKNCWTEALLISFWVRRILQDFTRAFFWEGLRVGYRDRGFDFWGCHFEGWTIWLVGGGTTFPNWKWRIVIGGRRVVWIVMIREVWIFSGLA